MLAPRDPPTLLSIVIPMLNEEAVIPLLRSRLADLEASLSCAIECVVVDDGSTDGTVSELCRWAEESPSLRVVVLSRNFGHQMAITAGLDFATGDAAIIMDADLQDPPELIPDMVRGYCEGYDVVYAQRIEREGETTFKRVTANLFYRLMRRFIVADLPENTGDFRLISRQVIDDLRRLKEHDRFLRGLVTWVGYHQKALPYRRAARVAGQTKYPFLKMLRFAGNAMLSFSDLPLRGIIWLGLCSVLASFGLVAYIVVLHIRQVEGLVPGWASISVFICFFSGVILLAQGMIGIYVGKIYTETQQRPLYLVAHTRNLPERTARAEAR